MKKILIIGISVLVIAIIVSVVIVRKINYVDTSFATEVSLKYHYGDKKIDVIVTDEADIKIIKENFKGVSYRDYPACGFDLDTSITLSGGGKSIAFCPACDECGVTVRINDSNRYINTKDWEALRKVLEKYDFTFPCV